MSAVPMPIRWFISNQGAALALSSPRHCDKRQQSHVARPLDGSRDTTLVPSARAATPPWQNLAAVRNMPLQSLDIFVVRRANLVRAEHAHLAARGVTPSPAGLWRGAIASIHHAWRWGSPSAIIITTATPAVATTTIIISH